MGAAYPGFLYAAQDQTSRPNLLLRIRPFIGLFQIPAGFVDRALGVVVGLHCLPIFVHRPVALSGHVEDFPQRDVTPYLSPLRLVVSAERITVSIRGSLVITLVE